MRYGSILSILAATIALAGCSQNVGPRADPVLAARLREAPTSVQVGDATLTLSAYLWRDFMPGPGMTSNGSPLIGSFTIRTLDPNTYPPVTFEALWVVYRDMVWTAKLEGNPLADPAPGTILKMARNGPRWPTGATVDVIAEVGLTDGSTRLIRVAGVVIQRTE